MLALVDKIIAPRSPEIATPLLRCQSRLVSAMPDAAIPNATPANPASAPNVRGVASQSNQQAAESIAERTVNTKEQSWRFSSCSPLAMD
jgi:hypothetical protein